MAVVMAAVVVLNVPTAAHARRIAIPDSNDARGPLDVSRVRKLGRERPLWRITTWWHWRAAGMRDRGYLLVYLDTLGDERYDYRALVFSDGPRMKARLFRDRAHKRDSKVAYLRAWRRDRRSASVRIPLRKVILPKRRDSYRWYVQTLFTGKRCRRVCYDFAPQHKGIEEPLGARVGPTVL